MTLENQDKLRTMKDGIELLRPVLAFTGVTNYPTVDEIIAMGAGMGLTDDEQVAFCKGYLKGTGKVMGNLGNITKANQQMSQSRSEQRPSAIAKFLSNIRLF